MNKINKMLWIPLFSAIISIFLLGSTLASLSYDQGVYRIDSAGKYATITTPYSGGCIADGYKTYCSTGQKYVDTIHYTQYATESTRKSLFGDYIKEYSVYITNKGITGRYFTVTFELTDKNGYEIKQSVTQYLRTGEQKKFVYRDIQYEQNEILNWNYRVIPQRY